MERNYQPIDCDFHDELEARAVTKKKCRIVYHDRDGRRTETDDVIADIFTREHEEFLRLERSGEEIRLDDIVSVDGKKLRQNENATAE